jgi:hypothetical protein
MSEKLPLRLIRTDGGTQPRAELNKAVIEEYTTEMSRGDEFPPVVVFHDGAEYWLADGFHRVNARKGTGYGDITVDIRQGTKRDAILHSLGANAIHGMRRTNEDKRRAVERMLRDREWRTWADREVARHCAVSPQTVGTVRRALEAASVQVGQIETKRTAKRGRATYTMDTAGLKRPAKLSTNRAVVTKSVDSLGRDERPVALNRFSLSLRGLFDMMNEIGREPDKLLDYAAQHRASFDAHEVQRAAQFLSDLANLLEADQGAAAAEIRAEGAWP